MGCVINEWNLFPSFGNSKSSYARSNYKCKILVSVTQIQVSETWNQVTLVNYASQLSEPNWNPWYILNVNLKNKKNIIGNSILWILYDVDFKIVLATASFYPI